MLEFLVSDQLYGLCYLPKCSGTCSNSFLVHRLLIFRLSVSSLFESFVALCILLVLVAVISRYLHSGSADDYKTFKNSRGVVEVKVYQVIAESEIFTDPMTQNPPNFPSGGKLKIRNKGHFQGNKRGDLILSINTDSNVSASK